MTDTSEILDSRAVAGICYTPRWIDDKGNAMVFLGERDVCDEYWEAAGRLIETFPFYLDLGLKMNEVQVMRRDESGSLHFEHADGEFGPYTAKFVAGPIFDEAKNAGDQSDISPR